MPICGRAINFMATHSEEEISSCSEKVATVTYQLDVCCRLVLSSCLYLAGNRSANSIKKWHLDSSSSPVKTLTVVCSFCRYWLLNTCLTVQLAWYCLWPCVCLCPLHASITLKWLTGSSCFLTYGLFLTYRTLCYNEIQVFPKNVCTFSGTYL